MHETFWWWHADGTRGGGRERKRVYKPEDDNPETYLKAIEKAKLDADVSQSVS